MQGVRKVSEMRRHLDSFVNSELFKGQQPPEKMRRRFFPTNKDMYNHMYKAKVAHRFSALDQKNLDVLVKKWKAESPLDSFLYEPHCSTGNSNASMVPMAESNGDEPSDDVPDPQPAADTTQSLLFCHQTKEQRQLLHKYGNQMCLLDATYRTTKYALPLFFLCVRTNVCYQVVGSFVVQYENMASIQRALMVFKEWNPAWHPSFFMVDFAEEEIQALERVFPGM